MNIAMAEEAPSSPPHSADSGNYDNDDALPAAQTTTLDRGKNRGIVAKGRIVRVRVTSLHLCNLYYHMDTIYVNSIATAVAKSLRRSVLNADLDVFDVLLKEEKLRISNDNRTINLFGPPAAASTFT